MSGHRDFTVAFTAKSCSETFPELNNELKRQVSHFFRIKVLILKVKYAMKMESVDIII